jgi:hypothetical protein
MESGLSMASRAEITTRYAKAYKAAAKKDKGRLLDEVVAVTGRTRDNARRRLTTAANGKPGPGRQVARLPRKQRARKYSYDTLKVLQRVWAASGGQCGKYLAAAMPTLLDALERHGELVEDRQRYGPQVRAELLAMSAATIDRYLAPARERDTIRGVAATRASTLLRSSITIRKAGEGVEERPGFFEGDTVAHCGPTLRGEFARTVNLTDVRIGWVHTRSVRNNAHTHVLGVLKQAVVDIPFAVTGLDFDNGGEFLNHDVVNWAAGQDIYFTRARPYRKNDQATIESKNHHLVRTYGFYYRYDTEGELAVLNRLWPLVNDRFNFFTPTKKPAGWGADRNGKRKRLYDAPATPFDRLIAAGVLTPAQQAELAAYRDRLNPADLARRISDLQNQLVALAKDKTDQLRIASHKKLPDTAHGVKLRATS